MTEATKSRRARRGNVVAIRAGQPIPVMGRMDQFEVKFFREIAKAGEEKYLRAVEDGEDKKQIEEYYRLWKAGEKLLPKGNLQLKTQPVSPRKDWVWEMWRKWGVVDRELQYVLAQVALAQHLDQFDQGGRAKGYERKEKELRIKLDAALLDLLRTPAVTLSDLKNYKQPALGGKAWATTYRAEYQAIIDEEEARLVAEKTARQASRAMKKVKA